MLLNITHTLHEIYAIAQNFKDQKNKKTSAKLQHKLSLWRGVAYKSLSVKSDFSQICSSSLDLITNMERFTRIWL